MQELADVMQTFGVVESSAKTGFGDALLQAVDRALEPETAAQRVCQVQATYERLVQCVNRLGAELQRQLEQHDVNTQGVPGYLLVKLEELRALAASAPAWTAGDAAKLAAENRCLHERNQGLQRINRELSAKAGSFEVYRRAAADLVFGARLTERAIGRLQKVDEETREGKPTPTTGLQAERVAQAGRH